jgi:ribosomal protein S18 acetylase RimI-like enzyme
MITVYSRLQRVFELFVANGFKGFCGKVGAYLRYQFVEKWRFVYLEWSLDDPAFSLPEIDGSLVIRVASREDIPKIEQNICPFLTVTEENDKRYFSRIGEDGFKCFIAERDNRVVHYFLVDERAKESVLMKTPFDKAKVRDQDAYLVSTFTNPDSRGLWIVPHTLLKIFEYLKKRTDVSRVLVLVHQDTPGAEGFYRRLGFSKIDDACSSGPITSLVKNVVSLWK